MDVTKPYKIHRVWGAMDGTKPYKFIGFGIVSRLPCIGPAYPGQGRSAVQDRQVQPAENSPDPGYTWVLRAPIRAI